jgi:choline dehydrogenase
MKSPFALSLLFSLFSSALAGVTTNPAAANGKTFDYIVVGAGLTGITVAARLAENSSITVLLVEAGADNRQDPRVFDIYKYGQAFGSELDWQWPTEKGKMIASVHLESSIALKRH